MGLHKSVRALDAGVGDLQPRRKCFADLAAAFDAGELTKEDHIRLRQLANVLEAEARLMIVYSSERVH